MVLTIVIRLRDRNVSAVWGGLTLQALFLVPQKSQLLYAVEGKCGEVEDYYHITSDHIISYHIISNHASHLLYRIQFVYGLPHIALQLS